MSRPEFLYQTLLGSNWERLPAVTRALHSPSPIAVFSGTADIAGGRNGLARLIARLAGLPRPGKAVPATITVRQDDREEILSRDYAGRVFETRQRRIETASGPRLAETIGGLVFTLRLDGGVHGIDFHPEAARWHGWILPAFLVPRLKATERAEGETHLFDVEVGLPGLGRLVAYRGRLRRTS